MLVLWYFVVRISDRIFCSSMKSLENLNDYKNYRAWFLGTLTHIKSQEKCRTRMMKLSLSLSLRCALRMQLCYIRWFATHAGGHSLFFVFLYLKYLGKIYFNPNRTMYLHKTSQYRITIQKHEYRYVTYDVFLSYFSNNVW